MPDFKVLAQRFYLNGNQDELDKNKLEELRNYLKELKSEQIVSIDDHKEYLQLVSKFRATIAELMALNGANFNKTIASLLSVGADGLYSSDLRFLFELIQNVDDCDYADMSNCELDVHFDFNAGSIELKYNETGFKPSDVFAITGIAEKAKNVSPDKIEIGEKGIGFKSVFGVAEKVLIQSGKFSFMLHKDNFTIPQLKYDNFEPINGTKITLYLNAEGENEIALIKDRKEKCQSLFNKLVAAYSEKDSLFKINPILFLNKLTKIKIYYDSFDSLMFTVSKSLDKSAIGNDVYREDNVEIFSEISFRKKNIENKKNAIVCTRYTMPIKYDRKMCVSRYGEDTAFDYKNLSMQIIIPETEYLSEITEGSLYSFLPTQIKTNVPISCHIPFKLDSSREYIDDQHSNEWFVHSCGEFSKMLCAVYNDYARKAKNNILCYLPVLDEYFFRIEKTNDKTYCLRKNGFIGSVFLELPIFLTEENHYKSYSEIFCFSSAEAIKDPITLCLLMDYKKELFIPSSAFKRSLSLYGIEIVSDIYFLLLTKALKQPEIMKNVIDAINDAEIKYEFLIEKIYKQCSEIKIPFRTVIEISAYPELLKTFNAYSISKIREYKSPLFCIEEIPVLRNIKHIISKDEPIESDAFDVIVNSYIRNINYSYAKGQIGERQFFVANNILVLSDKSKLLSLALFARELGKNDYFYANMIMRAATLQLNDAENSLPVDEFMELLYKVRSSIKKAFGAKPYASYIEVIRKLSADPKRFIRELLQNADDCKYDDNVKPYFKLSIDGNRLITEHNEKGFTKENVRAITSIGESTKKQIYSGDYEIGEKGIGFKTVFAVADKVEIHSNEFHFSLEYETPTIPRVLSSESNFDDGTKMIFTLRDKAKIAFTKEEVFALCMCLRNLKDITINDIHISIEDKDGQRFVTVNKQQYVFDIFAHEFSVTDPKVIEERCQGGKTFNICQRIVYYLPVKEVSNYKYYLYEGLPTAIELDVPLIINAPYELNSSRDDVLQGHSWNNIVRTEMYNGYIRLLEEFAPKYRIRIMKLIRFSTLFGQAGKVLLFKKSEWLNDYPVSSKLKLSKIIPTYDEKYFTIPNDFTVFYYPAVIHKILALSSDISNPKQIIDNNNAAYDNVLKNLGCKEISYNEIVRIICCNDELLVNDEELLKLLFEYLNELPDCYHEKLKDARIIPVKGISNIQGPYFVSYNDYKGKIFVEKGAVYSASDYKVLNTDILSKSLFEKMLAVSINEMDDIYKQSLYAGKLRSIIESHKSLPQKYNELMRELTFNKVQFENSVGELWRLREQIPFKMENGDYATGNVFISSYDVGYFNSPLLTSRIVAKEANRLAMLINSKNIRDISYEDLDISDLITEDDIMDFQLSVLNYGYFILNQCMFDGFISEDLIEKYGLAGIKSNNYSDVFDESDFPDEPVRNLKDLRSHMLSAIKSARKIIKVKIERTEDRIEIANGNSVSIDHKEIRENTLRRYKPASNTDGCFCQMCRMVKSTEYLETNNIFKGPEYYWPQTRVALCFDCSKKFTMMRENDTIMNQFYDNIVDTEITSDGAVDIPIGDVDIRFTFKHLAELQEIIKSGKK